MPCTPLGKGRFSLVVTVCYHWLNRHKFEQDPEVGDRQGSLACCSPWGRKESDITEQLNWTISLLLIFRYSWQFFPFMSVQFSSVAQLCPTLCDPMNCSTPGLPVHHQLPEFTQTHVHWVSDAIQPSHPLSSPSPAPNPSQHQSLFQWINSSHEVARV